LKQKASLESSKAEKILITTKDARETIFRVFSAIAEGTNPKEEDLSAIVELYQEAIGNGQLVKTDGLFIFKWEPHKSLDGILWQIVASAQSLLSSKEVARVKECPNCGWLFLDTSKNQSRRWCSMNTCGVHEKMRRYHKRLKNK
ncbi:MAG: CGNR zinc finger domain-containing protein, partial [Chloroflexota bacterium]